MFSQAVKIPPSEFVCRNASPGIGCGFPEMLFLGILYLLSGLFCLIRFALFLRKYILSKANSDIAPTLEESLNHSSNISSLNISNNNNEVTNTSNLNDDQNIPTTNLNNSLSKKIPIFFMIFWFSMFFWMTYDGIVTIVPFNYSRFSYQFLFLDLDKILSLIPLSFFVLLVLEICFAWRNPDARIIIFFRVVFAVFLFVFLLTGIMLSLIEVNPSEESTDNPSANLSLWIASTDFLISIFFLFPALQLIKLVSTPIVQPEDVCCVRISKVGTAILFVLFVIKCAFNLCRYVSFDPISDWASNHDKEVFNSTKIQSLLLINNNTSSFLLSTSPILGPLERIYRFFQFFLFNLFAAWLAIGSTLVLSSYDFKFLDESQYTRTQNSVSNN